MQHNEELNLLNVSVLTEVSKQLSEFPVDTSNSSRTAPHALSMRYYRFAVSRDTGLHTAAFMAAQQLTIISGAYWNGGCITPTFVMSITSRYVWWKSGRCLIKIIHLANNQGRPLHVFGYAFENKEDILNISCL